jgi:hypothetical protein
LTKGAFDILDVVKTTGVLTYLASISILENYQMRKNIAKLALLVVPLLFVVQTGLSADTTKVSPAEPAQGEEINWQVISSGGTEGTSTNFVLKGTVGQTAVGYGSSTNYGLSHGYWQEFGPTTCCNHDGIRGDADGSGSINVADPTYLTDYIFFGGDPPPCQDPDGTYPEGDADGSGSINVADPTYLTDYIFFGGPDPLPCP